MNRCIITFTANVIPSVSATDTSSFQLRHGLITIWKFVFSLLACFTYRLDSTQHSHCAKHCNPLSCKMSILRTFGLDVVQY